jgi:hypothetical protein
MIALPEDEPPYRRRVREFARRVTEGMRLARITPDEPVHVLFDAVGNLPTELDRVHEEWRDITVQDVRRALEAPTRHMEHATADLIEAGRLLSRGMAVMAGIALVVGGLLGYALAPGRPAPDNTGVAGVIDQSIDAAIARHCQVPASR